MAVEHIETVVIGGGQAGLAMSYHLAQRSLEHVVLERARVAERWRSERWDSLCFQSPKWNVRLPGFALQANDPNAFATRDEIVNFIESYAANIRAPVRCGVAVHLLSQHPDGSRLLLDTSAGRIEAKNVVVATGPYQVPVRSISIDGAQLVMDARQYRRPDLLPDGAVLVIGSGNSGSQIAHDLCAAGRSVFLSVSPHERTPRRYLGRDSIWWHIAIGDADAVGQQKSTRSRSRLMSGVGGGRDVDLRQLARDGVVLLGRVVASRDGAISLAPDLAANLASADASLAALIRRFDEHAIRVGLDQCSDSETELTFLQPEGVSASPTSLNLRDANVTTIVWAAGYRSDFSWIAAPIIENESAQHRRGVTNVPGLYFLGLPWLHKHKSAFLFGVGDDAAYLAEQTAHDAR
jgi:putative flavoprotein involved in K+ transport